jgi:hypothetical protein
MKYLIATLDKPHYLWQVLVQINNFRKLGIEQDAHFVISCTHENPSDELMKIVLDDSLKCTISLYEDSRPIGRNYPVTVRHSILKTHFECFPEWEKETFMLIDPDVIFTKTPDWSHLEQGDKWYFSNTISYLHSPYIKSKSEQLFHEMCEIVGISPEFVEANDKNAGGAQYVMKNVTAKFWEKCEIDSENLYNHMKSTESIYHPEFPIQSWTADMWAILWNSFLQAEVEIPEDMTFCWASDAMEFWNKRVIFHNAGVTGDGIVGIEKRFAKGLYQKSPFNKTIDVSETSASYMYLQEVRETEKNFPNLIF